MKLKTSIFKDIGYIYQKYKINKFAKRISFKKNLAYFNYLYQNIDGYQTSKQDSEFLINDTRLYGEVDFFSFAALLSLIKPTDDDTFFDLGSGVGKPCLTAALAFDIKHCCGIEINPLLHMEAMNVYAKSSPKQQQQLLFINDDFFNQPLKNASIVFINATAFFGEKWLALEKYLIQSIPKNCRVLISSKQLPSLYFKLLDCKAIKMDYGQSHVYIYLKIGD